MLCEPDVDSIEAFKKKWIIFVSNVWKFIFSQALFYLLFGLDKNTVSGRTFRKYPVNEY